MRSGAHQRAALPLVALAVAVQAQGVVYVTDLPLFSRLAPCAADALSYVVMSQTRTNCPQAVTDLQGCVCTKNNNLGAVSSAVSSSVSYSCGSTASEDQASASTVLSAYCNQASMPSFPTPSIPVSQFITDIAEFQNLAPCAQSALSYVVMSMTRDYCPPEATALATCACQKQQNSLRISQTINSSVRYSCATHTADVTSAQSMFAAYCALNSGTSAFPKPSPPPGDMTYYVTALPQYSALAPCAQSGLSYAMRYQTNSYCPEGVQALASCVCLKESMSGSLSSSITSNVKWSCSSTATEDISSALNVFDFYCSAAQNLVKATGVVESIAQTYPTAKGGGGGPTAGPKTTGGGSGGGSGGGNGGNGSNGGGNGGSSPDSANGANAEEEKKGPNVGLIAGAVGGGVAVLIAIVVAVFFIMRNKRRKQAAAADATSVAIVMQDQKPPGYFGGDGGKAELAGNPIVAGVGGGAPPHSPSPSMLKANAAASPRTDNVSPISAHHGSAYPPPPLANGAELQGNGLGTGVVGASPSIMAPSVASPYAQVHSNQFPGQSQSQPQYYSQVQQLPPRPLPHEMQGAATYSTMIRPELYGGQAHNAAYSPLSSPYGAQSGGGLHHHPSQSLHEVSGSGGPAPSHVYEAGEARPMTASSQHHLHPSSRAEMPGMSWHSGPVAGYSELDARGGAGGGRFGTPR